MDNDLLTLRESWSSWETPPAGAQERARAALHARMAQSSQTPMVSARVPASKPKRVPLFSRWSFRLGVATMAAAGVAAVVVFNGGSAGTGGGQAPQPPAAMSPANSAKHTMELAAAYAAAQPFTAPRPNQWVYVQLHDATRDPKTGQLHNTKLERWVKADGSQAATVRPDGKGIEISDIPPTRGFNGHSYPAIAALSTDPQTLLAQLRASLEPLANPAADRNPELFGLIGYILRQNVLSPDVTATLLRAASLIPGVTQDPGTIVVNGRPAVAVGIDGYLTREETLFDPNTYEFLGSRGVAAADLRNEGDLARLMEQAGYLKMDEDGPHVRLTLQFGPVTKGDVEYLITRGACAIVDAPGRTS